MAVLPTFWQCCQLSGSSAKPGSYFYFNEVFGGMAIFCTFDLNYLSSFNFFSKIFAGHFWERSGYV